MNLKLAHSTTFALVQHFTGQNLTVKYSGISYLEMSTLLSLQRINLIWCGFKFIDSTERNLNFSNFVNRNDWNEILKETVAILFTVFKQWNIIEKYKWVMCHDPYPMCISKLDSQSEFQTLKLSKVEVVFT